MDLQLINKGMNFTKRKKKWVVILAVLGVTGYGAYRVYNSPSIVRKRIRVFKLINALFTISENVCDSAELIGVISRDLKVFLQSDCDEIPQSLKQVVKLVKSDEFDDVVVRVTAAFTKGVFKGYDGENGSRSGSGSGYYNRFIDMLFSDAGSGFVSVVAGSFARNLVTALYAGGVESENRRKNVDGCPTWIDVVSSDRGRELISEVIQKFVSTAVAVYLDKTMSVNTYDELFAGMTNPNHEKPVREMLVALCNGSIETLVKTSHDVLTKSGSDSQNLTRFVVTRSNSDVVSKMYYSEIDDACNVIKVKEKGLNGEGPSGEGWVSTVSSTLAVPSNRKLVLDVTGRVTFETVRSFLEFLLGRFFVNVRRSFGAVHDAVVETGRGIMSYFTAKSSVVASICLSLCLHVLGGPWALMLA